jgi:hypothetical protein
MSRPSVSQIEGQGFILRSSKSRCRVEWDAGGNVCCGDYIESLIVNDDKSSSARIEGNRTRSFGIEGSYPEFHLLTLDLNYLYSPVTLQKYSRRHNVSSSLCP